MFKFLKCFFYNFLVSGGFFGSLASMGTLGKKKRTRFYFSNLSFRKKK